MYGVMRVMMGDFSYFLEKYAGMASIIWTIIFMAFCTAVIISVIVKTINIIYNKKKKQNKSFFAVYVSLAAVMSYIMNRMIMMPYTWNSKLQRVMSNFQYITQFPANSEPFFEGLKIPANVANQESMFQIAFFLNDRQWTDIYEKAGDSGWYFGKVWIALKDILRLGGYHMSLGVMMQGWMAYIPMILMIALAVFMFWKKKFASGTVIVISAVMSLIFTLGGAIFTCLVMYFGILSWMSVKSNINVKFDKEKFLFVKEKQV